VKRRTARARLGELADGVYLVIYNMTPRQRRAAARALSGLTATNCSANLYRLRPTLLGFIDDASSARERRGRARALALEASS
jgi:hypothetical protein